MRKRWLGFLALLASGGSLQAQYPNPYQQGYPMPGPHGYPAAGGYQPIQQPPYYPQGQPVYGYPSAPMMVPGQSGPFMPAAMQAPMQQVPTQKAVQSPQGPANSTTNANTIESATPWWATESAAQQEFVFHRSTNECFWFKTDFLVTRIDQGPLPTPLVTGGVAADPFPGSYDPANAGTITLFGGQNLNFGLLGGVRLEAGAWLDSDNNYSIDLGWLILSPSQINFAAGSNSAGSPLIARPLVNAATGNERSSITSLPGTLSGTTTVNATSDLWGMELNSRYHGYTFERVHAEALIGFRTVNLRESVRIRDYLRDINGGYLTFNSNPLGAGDQIFEEDLFRTSNQFYGFQLGGEWHWERDWFTLGLMGKMAVGITDQETRINGTTTVNSATMGIVSSPGGVLTQLTNIGDRHKYIFGFMPEVGANIAFNLSRHVRFQTGYSFMLLNSVIRPGDLIDRAVNYGLPPSSPANGSAGPPRPTYVSREHVFTTHTFNFGLEIHF